MSSMAKLVGQWALTFLVVLLCSLETGCVSTFKGAKEPEKAQCRNVARSVTGASGGFTFAEAYDDCMIGRGFQEW